jgi:hypothetical protein
MSMAEQHQIPPGRGEETTGHIKDDPLYRLSGLELPAHGSGLNIECQARVSDPLKWRIVRPLATITKRQRRELEICLTREWPQLYTGQYAVQDRTHDVYAGRAPARCCGRLHTYLEQNSLNLFSRRPANETTTCKPCGSWAKGTERRIKLVIFGASQGWQRVRFGIAADPHRAGTTGWAKKNS